MVAVRGVRRLAGASRNIAAQRRSSRLTAATNTSSGSLVVERDRNGGKGPPRVSEGRQQEVHEVKPDHPIPFPLDISGDVEVAKVEVTPEEKNHVLEALRLILLAACDLELAELGGLPSSLDSNHDIVWDWRSVELTAKEYGAFAHAVVHSDVKYEMDVVSYDWTPHRQPEGHA